MSRTISIDCDPREVRIAVGSSGLTGVSVEHVLSAPLDLGPEEDYLESAKTVAAIQLLLKQAGVRSGNAIVCIGRSSIELRSVQLPSVEKNELPDMVRFAAQRHFANVGDSWPIDFVVLSSSADGMTEVLAASMNPARIERISKLLEANGLKLSQLVLRPMVASTVALSRRPELGAKATLFIDLLKEEADMAIVEGKHVVFMRTIRFDADQDEAAHHKTLTSEIKRTLLAAASQKSGLTVSQAVVWGAAATTTGLCNALSNSLGFPVESLDPFDLVDASAKAKQEAAGEQGRYAAVIGSLLAPSNSDQLIDFCNPRKREEKKSPVRTYLLAGAAATVLLGGAYYLYSSTHSALDEQIEELSARIKRNEADVKTANQRNADWKRIETFLSGNYVWLDELEYLSDKSLSGDKVILKSASFSIDPAKSSGLITAKYLVPDQDNSPLFQRALRDKHHEVNARGVTPNSDKSSAYPYSADLTMRLAPQVVSDPRKWTSVPIPEKLPDDSAAAESTASQPASPSDKKAPNEQPTAPSDNGGQNKSSDPPPAATDQPVPKPQDKAEGSQTPAPAERAAS